MLEKWRIVGYHNVKAETEAICTPRKQENLQRKSTTQIELSEEAALSDEVSPSKGINHRAYISEKLRPQTNLRYKSEQLRPPRYCFELQYTPPNKSPT